MKVLISHNKKNKENIAKAIELLYKPENGIEDYIRKMLIDRLLWATTEQSDNGNFIKYSGQPFWSVGALKRLLENKNDGKKPFEGLRHEHSVPKKVIKNSIINLQDKTFENIFKILDNLGHAVVVSKEENDELNKSGFGSKMPIKLPDNPTIDQIFSRYKEVKVKICNINDIDIKHLNQDEIDKFCILLQ